MRETGAMPLLRVTAVDIFSPPCHPGAETYSCVAKVEGDIRGVLPYLNAVWPGADYDAAAGSLSARRGRHHVVVQPGQVAIGGLLDRAEAESVLAEVIDEINAIWQRREHLTPRLERRPRPTLIDVFRLLPRSNCKACGEAGCYAFAGKLAVGQATLDRCPELARPEWAQARERLSRLVERRD